MCAEIVAQKSVAIFRQFVVQYLSVLISSNSMQSYFYCTYQVNIVLTADFGSSCTVDTRPLLEL